MKDESLTGFTIPNFKSFECNMNFSVNKSSNLALSDIFLEDCSSLINSISYLVIGIPSLYV